MPDGEYGDAGTGWVLELQGNVPTMASLFAGADAFEVWQRWVGLFAELFRAILELAAFGHTVGGDLLPHWISHSAEHPGTAFGKWNSRILKLLSLSVERFL